MKKRLCLLIALFLLIPLWACGKRSSEWKKGDSLPQSGNWKLSCDVTLSAATELTGNLVLDLNGHTVTREVSAEDTIQQAITVPGGKKLTIKDSGKQGTILSSFAGNSKSTGAATIIWGDADSVIVIDGGIYDGSNTESVYLDHFGGIIATAGMLTVNGGTFMGYRNVASSGLMEDSVEDPSDLWVTGGGTTIAGWESSQIKINGGEFWGGGCKYNNGGVIASNGILTINGGEFALDPLVAGTVTGAPNGGLILMEQNELGTASLTINGGTYQGSNVTSDGGCIYTLVPTVINGGIFNGAEAFQGGIISATECDLTISGGEFVGCGQTHPGNGGLVFASGEKLTIAGGSFTKGGALKFGCNIYYKRAGGQVVVSGDTYINGGFTVHGTQDEPLTLTFWDKVIVDNTGSNPTPPWNIRIKHAKLYLEDIPDVMKVAGEENTDINLHYDEEGYINGFEWDDD